MNTGHLSDRELQNYALERENCLPALSEHVRACTFCRQKAEMYQLLFSKEVMPPLPMFDFDLTESIMQQLPPSESAVPETTHWTYLIGTGGVVSAGIVIYLFVQSLRPLFRELAPMTLGVGITATITLFVVLGYDMFLKYTKQMKIVQFS
jgi:ATP-dependent protease ClpP protease subunit